MQQVWWILVLIVPWLFSVSIWMLFRFLEGFLLHVSLTYGNKYWSYHTAYIYNCSLIPSCTTRVRVDKLCSSIWVLCFLASPSKTDYSAPNSARLQLLIMFVIMHVILPEKNVSPLPPPLPAPTVCGSLQPLEKELTKLYWTKDPSVKHWYWHPQ